MKNVFLGLWLLAGFSSASSQPLEEKPRPVVFYKFQIDVFEEREGRVGLADSRSVEIPEGKMRGVFLAHFTLDLTVKKEKSGAAVDFQLVTLPPEITARTGRAFLDSGKILSIPDLPGKGGSRYRAVLKFEGRTKKTVGCSFEDFQWNSDPAARHDFGFVPYTWGDYHWNLLRDRVEDMTDSLSKIFYLVTSQRPEYYFAPCLFSDWVWDGRVYFSLEPSRRRAVSAYGREANSFSPWVPNVLLFYLSWGYAPAPLVEGAAGYFDYPHFFARNYLKQGKLDSLSRLLSTRRYRQLPPERGLVEAASFVRFLVERYGSGAFENLYRGATDLTLKSDLEKWYGKPVDSLESEWRTELQAFQPAPEALRRLAREEFWNYRFEEALGLYRQALLLDSRPAAEDYADVANQFYNLGRYDSARAYFERAYAADSSFWQRPYAVANFHLIQDDTQKAAGYFKRVLELDSSIADGVVRQAGYFFETGNFVRAESLYLLALKKKIHPADLAELNVNLGYLTWRVEGNFEKGNELLNAAWGALRQARSDAPGLPVNYWRLGELFLYKSLPDSAEANLKFALYLETRPYYLAKIFIRLGNLYDVLNRRPEALEHYRQVLQMAAAPLDRRRAQAYLARPFRLGSP
ncbi:MAG: tetratricopeptide repeat protein [candidate division Zixibacteria bacterium]|nr:tetratricopeptide repeat protein [candidate division Zixibacteria bacterium]